MGEENPDETTFLGYALDGFPIYGPMNDSSSLDECNGKEVDGEYRYHVRKKEHVDELLEYCDGNSEANNWKYILGCYKGVVTNTEVQAASNFEIPLDCVCEFGSGHGKCPEGGPEPSKAPVSSPVTSPVSKPTAPPVSGPTSEKKPNIIIMQPDDQLFFNEWTPPPKPPGIRRTVTFPDNGLPNLETLRLDGLQMMQAYTASPVCGTSRYATITGKYPSRAASSRNKPISGIAEVTIPTTKLEDEDCSKENLPATFKANGYRTGMVGKWHLTKFQDYSYPKGQDEIKKCGFDFVDGLYYENLNAMDYPEGFVTDGSFSHNMEWITYEAINFIEDDNTFGVNSIAF